MESVLVFFSLWTLFGVQGLTQEVFRQSAYRTWLDAESSCRKDNLGLLANLNSLTKDTTFDLEVSITDSDQYWTGGYRLGLFYWKYGCFTLDSAAVFMTGNLKEIGDTNSVSECARFCGEERQWVALVKRFCYCLSDVDETALVASRCPSPCPGDRMDSCGSDQAMSVYKTLNKTEILDDITRQPIGENQMCVFIMSDAGVIRWKVDNCTQQKIVLCQNVTKSGIEFVSPHRTPKSWVSANEDCQRGKMTLAVVTQNDVKKSPIDKLPPNVHVWVALRRHGLFYWTSGDIRDDPTDCLAVQKDTYGNLVKSWFPCSDQFKYVCLKEGQPPTVESAVIGTPAPTTASTAETTTMPTTQSTTKQITTQPTTQPTTEKMTTKPTTQPTTIPKTIKPTTQSTTKMITTQPTTMPTTEKMTTKPTTQPTTIPKTIKPTTMSTREQMTTEPTALATEQMTTQPTTEQITTQLTTQPTTMPTTEKITTIPTTQPTTEQMTTQPTTEKMTTPTTQPTTEQMTTQPTTEKLTTQTTIIPTTLQTTTIPTTEQITSQTTIQTTEQKTTQITTMQTTQPSAEQITTKPTTIHTTEQKTPQQTTMSTTKPQLTTKQMTTEQSKEQMTTKSTTISTTDSTTTKETAIVTTDKIKPIIPIVKSKSFLPANSTVLPTQPIATESNAFTNASNGLPNSGKSSEQSDNSPTTELILVILIFLALVLLAVFVLVQWAVKRRRRKSIRLNRRTSKEITFKGEDEMLIRSFRTSDDTTTLSPKPMPRIDIDTGSLQILANIPENKKKLHRSDNTLDIPWIDASMNTLDNVSVSRDTETRSDTIGTKALSAPELDRIGVDSDDEDDVPHPCAMRTFSKQNEPILESEI